ncbi:hypothetical protein ABZ249_17635 [Nocardiopsis sp. NPDC006139]|uniref:outer membrane protein assembly factor BamB family protein n=1 Tax=Nocardiopsis sp. NPDC006139 TaxID=3154578 RepID=UPI0033BEBE09
MTDRIVTLTYGAEAYAYAFTERAAESGAPVRHTARFSTRDGATGHAVSPALDRVAYAAGGELVCADRDGTELWRHPLRTGDQDGTYLSGGPSCAFSPDGRTLWLYRQGPMVPVPRGESPEMDRRLDRNPHLKRGTDRLLALDAADGTVLAEAVLGSSGHGALVRPHPDGEHVLVGVMEGQDGGRNFRARLEDGGLDLHTYGTYGYLDDLSPSGRVFLVGDESGITLHSFPDGEELGGFGLDAFDHDGDDFETLFLGMHLAAFLDEDRVVVSVHGERAVPEPEEDDEDEDYEDDGQDLDFRENHVVEAATGRVLGPLPGQSRHHERLVVIGDGSWLSIDGAERPRRHTL